MRVIYFIPLSLLLFSFRPVSLSDSIPKVSKQKKYELWYATPAPNRGADYKAQISGRGFPWDADWENLSLPLGNGYLGANIFGRTDQERIQLTENSLSNKGLWGIGSLTNFAEMLVDFGHKDPMNYRRSLSLNEAISYVSYQHENVIYNRQYFASYPDKVLVLHLTASQSGTISFTIKPSIPFLKNSDTMALKDDGRTGHVIASEDQISFFGNMQFYNINYEGQCKVIAYGGRKTFTNDNNNENGFVKVEGADSAMIIVALGTNYELKSSVFTEKDHLKKLDGNNNPRARVTEIINNAAFKSYAQLKSNHLKDYQKYFSRVTLDLGGMPSLKATDVLLADYKNGIINHFLEELYFQYGRYLLISSSRKGTLPSNLQGIWSQYDVSPWTSGYWHNINVQMNYWPAFNTNLAEMFTAYSDYNLAFRDAASANADNYIKKANPSQYDSVKYANGWAIGTGASPYAIHSPGSHSGPGTGGFTAKLFWDRYDFTRDKNVLKQIDYPAIFSMAKFLSKVVKEKNGLLLTDPSASPEQKVNNKNYETIGCAFDQQMIYENHHDVLKAAKILGDSAAFVSTINQQINQLDPVQVGWSGQIKEYREEKKYGEIGEYTHRHISQLVGLYPGTVINSSTPAWMDAAKVTLNERGDLSKGWAMAHRMNAWARLKDGNRSYKLFQTLLQKGTYDNLWDSHPPFQIDGNFGGTAGVAEMLLQSHEDCIEPLPALPAAWDRGLFKGLVARGNFEVSLEWTHAAAKNIFIHSRSGGDCKIKYNGIGKSVVKNNKGELVNYKKISENSISFSTKRGDRFIISSIPVNTTIQAPIRLSLVEKDDNVFSLSWDTVQGAVYYNIYRAIESAPTYELIKLNCKNSTVELPLKDLLQKERCTFRVTAVNKDGIESEGRLIYWVNKSLNK